MVNSVAFCVEGEVKRSRGSIVNLTVDRFVLVTTELEQ